MSLTQEKIALIIPALNEEKSVAQTVKDFKNQPYSLTVIVADNGSSDLTVERARAEGAQVVVEPERGYGAACLAGIGSLEPETTIVAFADADLADDANELHLLLEPIIKKKADFVLGSRMLGGAEKGALTPQARFGNWLATRLIFLIWGFRYTDLGPYRAIRRKSLGALGMQDRNFGWTVEMQIRALKKQISIREVAVSYHKRVGKSKVSGTIKGTVMAGTIILKTIFQEYLKDLQTKHRKPRCVE